MLGPIPSLSLWPSKHRSFNFSTAWRLCWRFIIFNVILPQVLHGSEKNHLSDKDEMKEWWPCWQELTAKEDQATWNSNFFLIIWIIACIQLKAFDEIDLGTELILFQFHWTAATFIALWNPGTHFFFSRGRLTVTNWGWHLDAFEVSWTCERFSYCWPNTEGGPYGVVHCSGGSQWDQV